MEQKDHYAELFCVSSKGLIKGKFVIYENDPAKGHRIIHYDLPSDSVYREEKF
jgi:hypothetical protein